MNLKKKIFGVIAGLLLFSGGALAIVSSGVLSSGVLFDSPMRLEWMQSATVLSDKSPDHNHGTVINATVGADSTDFDGSGDYVSFDGLLTTLASETDGTLCMTANADTDEKHSTPFAIARNAGLPTTEFPIDFSTRSADSDAISAQIKEDGTTLWKWVGTPNQLTPLIGSFVRFCVVQDGVEPKFYLDGVEDSGGSFVASADKTAWFKNIITDATSPADNATSGARRANGVDSLVMNGQIKNILISADVYSAGDVLLDYETSLS